MDAFGGFFVDEKAVRVENIFLEFLKRYSLSFSLCLCNCAADDGVCLQLQTPSKLSRTLLRIRDRGHESEGIDHDVRRFLARHPLQRRPPESHFRGIFEVIHNTPFFVSNQSHLGFMHFLTFLLLNGNLGSVKIRALSEECLQAICNGAETDFHPR